MFPNIKKSFNQIGEGGISNIEKIMNISFPISYRKFLLTHNGGKPYPSFFKISDNTKAREPIIDVHFFLGIDADNKSLLNSFYSFSGRIPPDLLPIAYTGTGNIICLGVDDKKRNQVFIWWHELEAEEEEYPDYNNVDLIADSFEEFINGFSEYPEK